MITDVVYLYDTDDNGNNINTENPFAIKATINGIRCQVPLDPANSHYAEIMRQVEAGELVIQEADSGSE
jgi:hypothetical protein